MVAKPTNWLTKNTLIDFTWIRKTKFIQLDTIDVSEDPVRPELDVEWRTSFNRKIYGLEYNGKVEAIMCLAFTNAVPHTVRELDLMCKVSIYEDNADTIVAYTVWSRKKGAGQKIMKEAIKYAKKDGFNKLVTLSPLTPMATHYHIRNGAKLISLNESTQNFEYSLLV
tara:strand:+ start:364 stop:867 length:504 start_codon:yes stop_codon:yes gene_type:complete